MLQNPKKSLNLKSKVLEDTLALFKEKIFFELSKVNFILSVKINNLDEKILGFKNDLLFTQSISIWVKKYWITNFSKNFFF